MKVGDKVLVEVEVAVINDLTFKTTREYVFRLKEIVTQLPIQDGRWMMVSDDNEIWKKRIVVGKFEDKFVVLEYGSMTNVYYWNYAKEIPTKTKLTMQEIANAFDLDVDNIEIV
jgi:hypothetical protein